MSSASSARSYGSSRSSSSPARTSASPACSSATPSPLNQYPPEQRGSKDFQRELTSLSGRLSQPISPGSAITPQGALNIARVENSMRAAGSGSLDIHLDPNPEDFTREKNIYNWRNRPVDLSHIPASLGVEELLNREPAPLDKDRAEEILREMAEERAARLRQAAANHLDPIHLDSESTDSDLGSAYYDTRKKGKEPVAAEYPILGLEGEEDGSHWSYDSPQSEEVADVTSQYKICNYNYAPAASPEPYVPPAQPELEGEIVFKRQIIPDGEESSTANEEVKVLACRDLPTSLTQKHLAEHIEQFQLEGHIVLPLPHMRCYRFNHSENGGRVPRMVLSTFLLRLGISSPLHPFIKDVCEYFQLAPLQINPNGYRAALALYIMYHKCGYPSLTARQLGYFLHLKHSPNDFGYFYFSVWPCFNKKNLIHNGPSNSGKWKSPYFYIHEVPRVQTHFYYNPCKFSPARSRLFYHSSFLLTRISFISSHPASHCPCGTGKDKRGQSSKPS